MSELHIVVLKPHKQVQYINLQLMESGQRREPVVLYDVPLMAQLEVKSLIMTALPQAQLTPQDIILRKKDNKFQAFLKVPSSKLSQICALKELTINKEKVCIKRSFNDSQIFINRIPDNLPIEDILSFLQDKFGQIIKYHEGQPHEQLKPKLRHCYIQFEKDEDAEKCLFSAQKLKIKDYQIRPSRNYAIGESDLTDKKLFLKVVSQIEDVEDLERVLNERFRGEGKLRQKIKVDNGKANIIFTSPEVADRVLQNFKETKIGKYQVVLRPHNSKDSSTAFLGGLRPHVTQAQIEEAFKHYSPIISCTIQAGTQSPLKKGTITFGSSDKYKQLLADYKQDPAIRSVFANNPYVAPHMNAKDRSEYNNSFKKGKQAKKFIPAPNMVGLPMYGTMPPVNFMGAAMGRPPMNNFYPMS